MHPSLFVLFLSLMMFQTQYGSSCDPGQCKKVSECPLLANMSKKQLRNRLCGSAMYCCTETSKPDPKTKNPPRPLTEEEKKQCGVSIINAKEYIVGGRECKLAQYPWMVAIYYRTAGNVEFGCGGTLISDEWILTAAHCIPENETVRKVDHVVLGDWNLKADDDGAYPIDMAIKNSFRHENYSKETGSNDIGLLQLKEAVNLTAHIRPICLDLGVNDRGQPDIVRIAGWSEIHQQFRNTPKLWHAPTEMVECTTEYSKQVDGTMLCAFMNAADACKGDSGGPLMFIDSNERWWQIGITSFGDMLDCGHSMKPGIYTKVAAFIPWIKEITGLDF